MHKTIAIFIAFAAGGCVSQGKRENRRIEVILVPDLSLLPGYEELQTVVQAQ